MKKKILLIGAGSAQFGYGMLGDILQSRTLEGSTIVLHDINETTLAEVTRKAAAFIRDKKLPYTVESAADRREALQDADFVVISIEVGDTGSRRCTGRTAGRGGYSTPSGSFRRSSRSAETSKEYARTPWSSAIPIP